MKDDDYMDLALSLAKSTEGQTSPNPPVGAVVVKNGEMIGVGTHLKAGESHAEVVALNMAGEKARHATIYITLEPCNHHGKTSPCTDLIIRSGIERVVIAMLDRNALATNGAEKLKRAGIKVELGVLQNKVAPLYQAFFHFITTKTPFVTLKTAISLDGKIATETGESKWITGSDARQDAHGYRDLNDAILVGVNTVIADNPSLTTRLKNGGKNPLRVILDTHLRTPIGAKVVTDHQADTWIFTGKNISEKQKQAFKTYEQVKIIQLNDKQIKIDDVLKELGRHGVTSLLVEGGSIVNSTFLKKRQIHQLVTYIAPKVIGGKNAPTSFAGEGIQSISNVLNFKISDVTQICDDIKVVAIPKEEDSSVYRDY